MAIELLLADIQRMGRGTTRRGRATNSRLNYSESGGGCWTVWAEALENRERMEVPSLHRNCVSEK